ncbi:MAG: CPBP family intramembrane metalloprotease [bacterium]|nr:CPBP family intramembrane metalloprotease [bacterium]
MADVSGQRVVALRRVVALLTTVGLTFSWIQAYWYHYTKRLFAALPDPWNYRLSMLVFALVLTSACPTASGIHWVDTWRRRRTVVVIGGGMILVSVGVMLFNRLPFYGRSPAIYLCVPLYEELIFRGFVFAVIADAFPRVWRLGRVQVSTATVLTAIAFGLSHMGGLWSTPAFMIFQVFYTSVAGLFFAIMRERTGSVWAPLLVHFFVDCWAVEVPGFWG